MFQTSINNTENDFYGLLDAFEKTIATSRETVIEKKYDEEWDMGAVYSPTYACLWNKISNIGEDCVILQKDDAFAFVLFVKDELNSNLLSRLYRLGDLENNLCKGA